MVRNSGRSSWSYVRLIIRLARLHFLIPGLLLYSLGALTAIANGATFEPGPVVFGYAIFLLAHLSVHFSNDYFDREGDMNSSGPRCPGGAVSSRSIRRWPLWHW
jgi:1,4-dihydroxy-2-naphthoate octaprenyltransferase